MRQISLLLIVVFFAFFTVNAQVKLPKALKKSYQYVPSGNVIIDGDTISVQGFYIYSREVTNSNYQEFLNWINQNGTEEMKQITAVNSKNWVLELSRLQSDAFAEKYHTHSAFRNYPVVNISQDAANLFCQWLEEIFKKNYNLNVKVRLPTHAEFIRAGQGDNLEAVYSWNGPYMRNSKGEFLVNFTRIPRLQLCKTNLLTPLQNKRALSKICFFTFLHCPKK